MMLTEHQGYKHRGLWGWVNRGRLSKNQNGTVTQILGKQGSGEKEAQSLALRLQCQDGPASPASLDSPGHIGS